MPRLISKLQVDVQLRAVGEGSQALALLGGYGLRTRCTNKQYKDMFTFTRAFGGPYHGWAFEYYCTS
jgi:hypothetical protein